MNAGLGCTLASTAKSKAVSAKNDPCNASNDRTVFVTGQLACSTGGKVAEDPQWTKNYNSANAKGGCRDQDKT